MCRIRKLHPLDLGNMLEIRFHGTVLRLIVTSVYEQRRDTDLVQLVDDAPCLE